MRDIHSVIESFSYKEEDEFSFPVAHDRHSSNETNGVVHKPVRKRLKRISDVSIDSVASSKHTDHESDSDLNGNITLKNNRRVISTSPKHRNVVHDCGSKSDATSTMLSPEGVLTYCIATSAALASDIKEKFSIMDPSLEISVKGGCTCVPYISTEAKERLQKEIESLHGVAYASLKEYQYVGVLWLLTLHEKRHSGILADDMGLGKTAQSITFLRLAYLSRKSIRHPCLVICPPTLLDNWVLEFEKWAPELRVIKYHGSQKERRDVSRCLKSSLKSSSPFHVILCSFRNVSNRWDRSFFFKHYKFGYVIVDEAHHLKNAESQVYQYLKKSIRCQYRLLLTGSPIQNEVAELQNLLLLLLPDTVTREALHSAAFLYKRKATKDHEQSNSYTTLTPSTPTLGNHESLLHSESSSEISQNIEVWSSADAEIQFLQTIITPFILRRLKCDVLNDFPAKKCYTQLCLLEGRQKELYMSELQSATSDIGRELYELFCPDGIQPEGFTNDDEISASLDKCLKKKALNGIVFRLRRICNHPLLYRGYYSDEARHRVVQFYCQLHSKDNPNLTLERVSELVSQWSDYDIHQIATEYEEISDLQIPPEEFLGSFKIREMLCLLDRMLKDKQKVLVFSYFTQFLDIIETTLQLHRSSWNYLRMDGSTPMGQRQSLTETFAKDDTIFIFLLSTKAAGLGLNLVAASCVILMDQDWNPHNDRQAEDRVHRLGQTRPISIYRLWCQDTLESRIVKIGQKKLSLDRMFGGTQDTVYISAT